MVLLLQYSYGYILLLHLVLALKLVHAAESPRSRYRDAVCCMLCAVCCVAVWCVVLFVVDVLFLMYYKELVYSGRNTPVPGTYQH